jgi:hypothetical protein
MTSQEVKSYNDAQDLAWLTRYDKLAEALQAFAESEEYSSEVTRGLENLAELCEEESIRAKKKHEHYKAFSLVKLEWR